MIIRNNCSKDLFKRTIKRNIQKSYLKDLSKRIIQKNSIQKNYSFLHIHPRYFAFTANLLAMFTLKAKTKKMSEH